jgi:hypothetical protein
VSPGETAPGEVILVASPAGPVALADNDRPLDVFEKKSQQFPRLYPLRDKPF